MIADDFLARLKRRIETLRIGDPLDKNTDIGAINSAPQLETIQRYIQIGQDEGAEMWQGAACPTPSKGYFCPPTLLMGAEQSHTVVREEIFAGLSVLTFRTPAEAIQKANDSEYGLAAGVWTEKIQTVQHRAPLNAGVVPRTATTLTPPLPSVAFGTWLRPRRRRGGPLALCEVRALARRSSRHSNYTLTAPSYVRIRTDGATPNRKGAPMYLAKASRKDLRNTVPRRERRRPAGLEERRTTVGKSRTGSLRF